MFDKTKVPIETVEYIALLDGSGNVLHTAPMDSPLDIPQGHKVAGMKVDLRVNVQVEFKGR